MIDPNMSTFGLKQMHRMQVEALLQFLDMTFKLAASTGDFEKVQAVGAAADELIRLFGGNGLKITIDDANRTDD